MFLCRVMRTDEREQLHAFFDMSEDEWPALFLGKMGPRYTVVDDKGVPQVAGGWETVSDGVMQSWMLCAEGAWDTHWRSITKASRWVMDQLLSHGVRRLQTTALASREKACEWYVNGLLMRPEGVWRQYCRQGQDMACFARTRGV